ncbi:MAG TPA: hypothetical protein VFK46_04125 [Candidatus Macondimonas sp.]|nr:hypothetical protein [Candidatus Macondimonas sp.]
MAKTNPFAPVARKACAGGLLAALFLLLGGWSLAAQADMTQVWRLEDGQPLTVESRDDQTLRLSWNGQVLLFREGRGYWVRWLDGVWQVVDLEDAQQGPLGPLLQSVLAEAGPLGPVSFRLAGTTGAQEQIAGLAGRVYNATGQLPDGTQVAETVVLATDADMQRVQRTLVGHLRRYGRLLGVGPLDLPPELERDGGLALLRYGKAIRLERLSKAPIAEERLELPAAPLPSRIPWPVAP